MNVQFINNPAGHKRFGPEYKTPLAQAVTIHLLVLVTAIAMPYFVHRRPHFPEVYTIDLVSVPDISRPAPSKQSAPAPQQPAKKAVSITKQTVPPVQTTPEKIISLKPRKQKTRIKPKPDLQKIERIKRERALEKVRAEEQAKRLKQEARSAAQSALSTLQQSIRASGAAQTAAEGMKSNERAASSGPAGSNVALDEIKKRYIADVYQQIQLYWVLPDLQNWDDSLKSVYVIKVRFDGIVSKSYFEKKSENIYFNQFVAKAVRDASPLPPFPKEIDETFIELGLRFTPGGIF